MAALPPFQIVAFFSDLDGRGWSEKYWTNTNMTQAQADSFVAAYLPARMALSTTSIFCQHIRIGSAVSRSPYAYFPTPTTGGVGTLQPPTLPSDSGLLIALYSSLRYVNKVFLRGLPEAIVQLEEKVADSTWDNNFTAFVNAMLGTGLIAVRTILGIANQKYAIASLSHNSPKGIKMSVVNPPAFSMGQVVRISGVDIPGYNGNKIVTQVVVQGPPTGSYILGGANPISDPSATGNYFVQAPTVSAPALSSIVIEKPTNRKTGRPFGLPRGRARTLFSQRP